MITAKELARLKELEKSATSGPWMQGMHGDSMGQVYQSAHVSRDIWPIPKNYLDAEFIAESRNLLPKLIESFEVMRQSLVEISELSSVAVEDRSMWTHQKVAKQALSVAIGEDE